MKEEKEKKKEKNHIILQGCSGCSWRFVHIKSAEHWAPKKYKYIVYRIDTSGIYSARKILALV